MGIKPQLKILFPKEFPVATEGVLFLERNILITGHENGFLVKWNLKDGSYKILFKSDSPVTTISQVGQKKIAIGYHSGGFYVIDLDNDTQVEMLREPKYSVNSRIWKSIWIDQSNLLLTSTYGEITPFRDVNGRWNEEPMGLKGHQNSVFGIDSVDGRLVATGDYRGNLLIWRFENGEYHAIQRLGIVGTIQDICWHTAECFTAITHTGKIALLEKGTGKEDAWQTVLEVDVARNRGVCVSITEDGRTIFAGTLGELIQFDLDSYQSQTIPISNVVQVFPHGEYTFVLNGIGLYFFKNSPVEIEEGLINYKFAKISLLGHTGTGKTTFCSRLLHGSIDNIHSTFGKKIFNIELPGENGVEKRIILHDHGGQESVLDTFIPFILDSDMILIFHKQTDKDTFVKSLGILKGVQSKISPNIPIYFVQTFIDHEVDDIPRGALEKLVENKDIADFVKMSPKDNVGFDEFEKRVLAKIDWNRARIMVQSPYSAGVSKTLSALQAQGYAVVPFALFREAYQELVHERVSERHLKFLLEDYTNQGIIEYYPDISELIILNDEIFNRMRTEIPKYADDMGGVVSTKDLKEKFDNETFLAILDEMYLQSGISIKNEDLRIFPHRLSEKPIELPPSFKNALEQEKLNEIYLTHQDMDVGRLVELLSDLRLQCIKLSRNEGLFAWEDNAFVYYFFEEFRRGAFERFIKFSYAIGGKTEKTKDRLRDGFFTAVKRAYGPVVDIVTENDKKKVDHPHEFDVALSFAGEQREYAERVAVLLERKGLRVFYDRFNQSQMWGENLVEYFQEVYYSKSKFCIMFISKEYLSKMWPSHERRSATARDLEQFGHYILPVIFEDVNVPGLDKYKGYLDARKLTPEDIANAFLEKLESEEKS